MVHLDRFVGNRRHAGLQQVVRQGLVRRQMQVGEEHLAGAEHRYFRRLWFLHLDNQFRPIEDGGGTFHHRCARQGVFLIGKAGANPGPLLDQNLVAAFDQLIGRRGRQRDTIFLFFDFFRYSNNHSDLVSVE